MRAETPGLSLRDLLLLLAAAVALLTPGLFSLPPVDRDESRYAVATTQMLQSRDFVDIRFQEQPRYLQPAGVYWLQSITAATFTEPEGRQIWAFRLPSLLGAITAVLATAWAAGRLFGRGAGLAAGLLLASCMSLGFEARIAKTDAPLLAAVTVAQFSLMRLYLVRDASWRTAALFWAALGAGVLLKGPIILLVSSLTLAALLLWDRRFAWLKRLRPVTGLLIFALIAAPWYVAIGVVSEGEFYQRAVGDNLLHKVGTGQQAHGSPPGYHLAAFALTFWPGSLLALFAAPFAWRERARPEVRFLLCWIIPTWIVFELVATKLPHYVLPTFPAIAALTAAALLAPNRPGSRLLKALFAVGLILWLAVSALVVLLGPVGLAYYEQPFSLLVAALAVGALGGVGVLLWALAKRRPLVAVAAGTVAVFFVTANVYGAALPSIEPFWLSRRIVAEADLPAGCTVRRLVTTPYHEPSLVFLNRPERTALAQDGRAAAETLARQRACTVAVIGAEQKGTFEARAAELGLPVTPVGRVEGQNYSDGEELDLTLYAAPPGSAGR